MSPDAPDGCSDSPSNLPSPCGSPFAAEPKLSVLHLMVWAACVAVYMSAQQSIVLTADDDPLEAAQNSQTVLYGLAGVFGGTYLAALPLLVLRRVQRRSFPRTGGEILWILGAIGTLQGLGIQLLFTLGENGYIFHPFVRFFLGLFLWLPLYIIVIRRCRGRWRVLFLLLVASHFLWYLLETIALPYWGGANRFYLAYMIQSAVVVTLVGSVAVLDLRNPHQQYPWPHWIGILLAIGSRALTFAWCILMISTGL